MVTGVLYKKEDFVGSNTPHYRMIYSSDTTPDTPIWDWVKKQPWLLLHECTHYFKEDQEISLKKIKVSGDM